MEDDFRNLTAKFGQIWITQSRDMIFQRFHCFRERASGGTLPISVMSQQYNCLMELYTNFYKILLFIFFLRMRPAAILLLEGAATIPRLLGMGWSG